MSKHTTLLDDTTRSKREVGLQDEALRDISMNVIQNCLHTVYLVDGALRDSLYAIARARARAIARARARVASQKFRC